MDDRRVGLVVRRLRRRRGWRQKDLAAAAGCSQSMISLVERGHVEAVSIRTLRAILRALDALVIVEVRWRGGQVDRLIDEDHAALVGLVAGALGGLGWEVRTEVTYSRYGERGSFDLLAWHAATSTLLVVEVKTQVASAEETLRKLDEKARLAPSRGNASAGRRLRPRACSSCPMSALHGGGWAGMLRSSTSPCLRGRWSFAGGSRSRPVPWLACGFGQRAMGVVIRRDTAVGIGFGATPASHPATPSMLDEMRPLSPSPIDEIDEGQTSNSSSSDTTTPVGE